MKTQMDESGHRTKSTTDQKTGMQRERRGQSLAAIGLVTREGSRFKVRTAAPRDHQESYEVWRDEDGSVRCSCPEYEQEAVNKPAFRCEHILAVKYSLMPSTANGESKMPADKPKTRTEAQTAGDAALNGDDPGEIEGEDQHEGQPIAEATQMGFADILRILRRPIDPKLIKTKEGWQDHQGNTHFVEYIEWHTVADILDRIAPSWSHAVRNITQVGDMIAVTASITINGVTREGVGTGSADNETGIKKAEHDALKRAAVKFGIARDLYQREAEWNEGESSPSNFPRDPRAKSLAEMVTPKQLWMIQALGRETGCDVEQECQALFQCNLEEISKRAASSFIDHLKRRREETQSEGLREAS